MACNHLNFLLESCKTVLHIEYGKNRSFVGNAQLSFEKNQALKKTLIKTGFFKKTGFFWFFSKFWFFYIPCRATDTADHMRSLDDLLKNHADDA